MMTESTLYWLTRLDHIHGWIYAVTAMSGVLSVISALATIDIDDSEMTKRLVKSLAVAFASMLTMSMLVNIFVPSTKEMAAILVVPRIANSETVKELGGGVRELAKQWIEELKPKKEGEGK